MSSTETSLERYNVNIFADTANVEQIAALAGDPRISGFTTNPTLMRAAGVRDYRAFIAAAVAAAGDKPVSFEVVSDYPPEIAEQAATIATLAPTAFVKVPITTSEGVLLTSTIAYLAERDIRLNVTAVFTTGQTSAAAGALAGGRAPAIISIFAGRIADAGFDALAHVFACRRYALARCPRAQILWASPRQVYDVVAAAKAGAQIITVTPQLLERLATIGKDLDEYSLETVQMFVRDARAAGYAL